MPSGNGMAATVLARLGSLCGRADFISQAHDTIAQARGVLQRSPTAAGQLLVALDLLSDVTQEIVILGPDDDDTRKTIAALYRQFIPNKVMAWRTESDRPDGSHRVDPIFQGRRRGVPSPTIFVCRGFTCGPRSTDGRQRNSVADDSPADNRTMHVRDVVGRLDYELDDERAHRDGADVSPAKGPLRWCLLTLATLHMVRLESRGIYDGDHDP